MKMTKWLLVTAVAVGMWTSGLVAQESLTTQKAQNKLLAARAARADAMRKLGERINGLFITSSTHVKDFVTESDKIKTAMACWLSGMKEVDKPKFNEDGTAEVTLEITMDDIVLNLEQMSTMYAKNGKFKQTDFEQMSVTNKEKKLTETGMGAPRALQDPGVDVPIPAGATNTSSLDYLTGAAKAWWLANVEPQQRLMAVRAAHVDGLRRLGERIKGVMITSKTSVKDFIAESDKIDTSMETFIQGAREVAISYHVDEPIVEVDMEVTMTSIYASLKTFGEMHVKGDQVSLKKLEELSVSTQDIKLKETGMGVARAKANVVVAAVTSVTAPGWISQTMEATGNAAIDSTRPAAQAKLMAFRGAELDARRKLSEQINGLMLTSKTKVEDFVTQKDEIKTHMMDFQVGAHVVEGSQKALEDGTVEVKVEIELRPLWNMVTSYAKQFSMTIN
jgi:hypothetical protein